MNPAAPDSERDGATSVTFERLTFSDGTLLELEPDDIVVLVGPNNAGKSATLRELGSTFDRRRSLTVLQSYVPRPRGTDEDFEQFVNDHATSIRNDSGNTIYYGYQWSFAIGAGQSLRSWWPDQLYHVKPLFCVNMTTEERITGSNPAGAIELDQAELSHPIHMLARNDELEIALSKHFQEAFGTELVLDRRFGGSVISLRVGVRLRPDPKRGEKDRASTSFQDRLYAATTPLVEEGDGMRSFASVILRLMTPANISILLLDEPEAFLHPPQARFLGELIATAKPPGSQLFIATHSPDVLQGLVGVASDRIRLVRIQRDGNVNHIKELNKSIVKNISTDALLNYSSVLSGVFHERVIVCEADSDCMFYSSILDLDEVHGEGHPDVLFVHANGKDRMPTLAKTLTSLGVPVDIVADIDVIRDETVFQRIVHALDGDWDRIERKARAVRTAIDNSKPILDRDQIEEHIRDALRDETLSERKLRSIMRGASSWEGVKQAGASAIPQGDATQQFQQLQALCAEAGLWIVPVGEMEGFCKSIGGKGPAWVQRVIEEKDLATDSELERAREFMRTLWDHTR